jgi:hypothetical protein
VKAKFLEKGFRAEGLKTIAQCNMIIAEYQAAGYTLTLRQLYYQLVARGSIRNADTEYDKLGTLMNNARLAGLVDWDAIEDRTRSLKALAHWASPGEIVAACAKQYRVDLWATQKYRPEVWVEKDALAGVVAVPAQRYDVAYFACRGYPSVTALYEASLRYYAYEQAGQVPYIIHLGDHDPSGIDMTRDIENRLGIFGIDIEVNRVALNLDQVRLYNPPPNPAKVTDSRYASYLAEYGDESWELDALEPSVLDELVTDAIEELLDRHAYEKQEVLQVHGREVLALEAAKLSPEKRKTRRKK